MTISGHGDAPAPSTPNSSVLAAAQPTPRAPNTSTTATRHHATSLSFSCPPPRTAHGRDQGRPEADLPRNLPPKSLNTLSLAETPPQDGFEWDEQDSPRRVDESLTGFPAAAEDPEPLVPDGMASLPVSVKEAGYLGVASGAAADGNPASSLVVPVRLRRRRHHHVQPTNSMAIRRRRSRIPAERNRQSMPLTHTYLAVQTPR